MKHDFQQKFEISYMRCKFIQLSKGTTLFLEKVKFSSFLRGKSIDNFADFNINFFVKMEKCL